MTTTNTRRRDWMQHDAAIPYRDERLIRMNGTNSAGRRPHALVEPERRPLYAQMAADNDNAERKEEAA